MKFKLSKKILTVLFCLMSVMAVLCFVGCGEKAGGPGNNGGNGGKPGNGGSGSGVTPPTPTKLFMFEEEMNPKYSSRTEALDTIFNPDELGELVLVFDRSEWNRHLYYCDYDLKHEDSVHAKGFYFKKDNKEWFFKDIGFRIRGNTSRRRPQEGNGVGNNDYVQAHFALDFEEWTPKGVDKKLADSMKGLILKRFKDDPTYSREVYSYNLFRQNGIWISPRASYTTLKIQIIDDLDLDEDGDVAEYETVNYGVYGMIEEIKKQFLKERTEEEGGGEFSNNKGNLWKCLGANFKDTSSIGEEDVHFEFGEDGNITNFVRNTFAYDYKSDDLDGARTQLLTFVQDLNNLPNCTDGNNDEADIETIKNFYTQRMDGDLFLRTYAINVILGMWDDYWINNNNYYFYFDKETKKAYFIPYDYDNSLGVSHLGVDAGTHNPLKWGNLTDGNHPLIQKILQVPEYMEKYKDYLVEYSNESSFFDDDNSIAQITKWQKMIKPYINSPNLRYHDTTSTLEDKTNATWGDTYRDYKLTTPGKMNYFTVRQNAIKACVNPSKTFTLTLNAGDGTFWNGEKTCTYVFTEGSTLAEVLANKFYGWPTSYNKEEDITYSYEKDGLYYYSSCFVDSNGKEIYSDNYSQVTLYDNTTYNSKYFAVLLPFEFNDDLGEVTFTFRPSNYNNCPTDIYSVHLVSSFTDGGWDCTDVNKLTKNSDGNYSITYKYNQLHGNETTFKFRVNTDNWFGAGELKYPIPSKNKSGEYNDFRIDEIPSSSISFNLNGGTIENGSLENSYQTNGYMDLTLSNVYRNVFHLENPIRDGYFFAGWTLTKNGKNFVYKMPWGNSIVYAKWGTADELVLPYEFSEDLSEITFIFRPSDYNVSLSSSINYEVYLMSSFTCGWSESACSEHSRLTKGNDGNYRLTLNTSDVYNNWFGFQFFVRGVQWLGIQQYTQLLTSENIADDGECFMIVF